MKFTYVEHHLLPRTTKFYSNSQVKVAEYEEEEIRDAQTTTAKKMNAKMGCIAQVCVSCA